MRSKAYILQNFCIIDSMKLYNQGFHFLYNTFYQGGKILPGVGGRPPDPSPGYASDCTLVIININITKVYFIVTVNKISHLL